MKESGYKVGYKKPPRNRQFKPGQSGNPRGRPRGISTFESDLIAELQREVVVVEDGQRRKVSKQRAFVQNLISSALNKDKNAVNALLAYLRHLGEDEEAVAATPDIEDVAMIRGYLARIEAQMDQAPASDTPPPKNPKGAGQPQ